MENLPAGLARAVLIRLAAGIITIGILLFLPAGTILYWQAWLYLAVLFVPMLFVLVYLVRNDRELLERRLRMREKAGTQKAIIAFSTAVSLALVVLPGLDHRFGWSLVPPVLVVAADGVVFSGYMLIFLTFRENSYASRVIEVERGQQVVSTGPYRVIRHPMYAGFLLMILATPVALGSYVALAVFPPILLSIILRILDEERTLLRELPGYDGYCRSTPYRLLPGIW